MITTPDLAASLQDSIDDSSVPRKLRRNLLPDFRMSRDGREAYEIRDLPGRGKGLVAKAKFTKREVIMVGFPVFIIRMDFFNEDHYTQRQKRSMLEAGVNRLPPEQRKAILGLAKSTGGEPIMDIIRTNGFGIEVDGVQHLALFIDGSVSVLPPTQTHKTPRRRTVLGHALTVDLPQHRESTTTAGQSL